MAKIGTYSLADLLATNTPASEFGLDNILETIQRQASYFNSEVTDQLGMFVEDTTDRRRLWGGATPAKAVEVRDDLGSASGKKTKAGPEMNYPLRKFSVKSGWTNEWVKRATVREVAKKYVEMQNGQYQTMLDEIAAALYNSDSLSFVDRFTDGATLSYCRAFLNADSAAIPPAPDGTTFTAASHTHYNGTSGASFAYGDMDTLISNVSEHGLRGLVLFVNNADISTLTNLSSTKFTALTHAVVAVAGATSGTIATDDPANQDKNNRLAGYWDGVPVWTKPWAKQHYYMCAALDNNGEKPLCRRQDANAALRGIMPEAQYGIHPVFAQEWVSYYGFAAWNRAACAFLYDQAQTTYTDPTDLVR